MTGGHGQYNGCVPVARFIQSWYLRMYISGPPVGNWGTCDDILNHLVCLDWALTTLEELAACGEHSPHSVVLASIVSNSCLATELIAYVCVYSATSTVPCYNIVCVSWYSMGILPGNICLQHTFEKATQYYNISRITNHQSHDWYISYILWYGV